MDSRVGFQKLTMKYKNKWKGHVQRMDTIRISTAFYEL
jgi:hypothetical protein